MEKQKKQLQQRKFKVGEFFSKIKIDPQKGTTVFFHKRQVSTRRRTKRANQLCNTHQLFATNVFPRITARQATNLVGTEMV